MTDKLLPCPFCGDPPRIKKCFYIDEDGEELFDIECYSCNKAATREGWFSKESAIKAWNTRADTPSISICRELNKCQTAYNELHAKYNKLLAFVKKVNDGFCLNQSDDEGLKMLVNYEIEAEQLLKELGFENE